MKGGKIVEVTEGVRKGKYGQLPNNKQHKDILVTGKVYIEYYEDDKCAKPVLEKGKPVTGIIAGTNLKFIGFYD